MTRSLASLGNGSAPVSACPISHKLEATKKRHEQEAPGVDQDGDGRRANLARVLDQHVLDVVCMETGVPSRL
jgi:hypothetical protein